MDQKKVIGLLVAFSFVLTLIIAITAYNSYDFFGQYLSELGIGTTGLIFNIGLMIISIFVFILYFLLYFKSSKINFFISGLSAIFLFGVGLFPMTIKFPHFTCALLFFLLSFFLIAKTSINLYFEEKKIDLVGIISIIIVLFYILVFTIPLTQKFSVFMIMVWAISRPFFEK